MELTPTMSLTDLAAALERALPSQQAEATPRTQLWLSDVTLLACRLLDVPSAFISVADSTTTRFLAVQGTRIAPAPRQSTLFDHVAARRATVVVPDASLDASLANFPAVQAGLRTYVGVPMSDREAPLSVVLCVSDQQPRPDVHEKVHLLEALARVAARTFTA